MNVLLVINVRWYNAEAAYVYSLAKELLKEGHSISLLTLPGSPVAKRAKIDTLKVFETDGFNSYNPFKVWLGVKTLIEVINENHIELINCHRSEGYPLMVLAKSLSRSKPAIVRTRGDQRRVKKGFLNRLLYGRYADGIIASGEVVKRGIVQDLGLKDNDVDVIYASVDTDLFKTKEPPKKIRAEFGVKEKAPLVSILGRLCEVKGHQYFIEAAATVSLKFPNARFLIIAKELDEGAERVRKYIRDFNMGDVVYITGFRDDLIDVMASSDIGVVASIGSETNCRVVLEWMAMGKPVVGTSVGVIPEVIEEGKTGLLAELGDASALAEGIMKLTGDGNLTGEMGKAARAAVEKRFNGKDFVRLTLETYNKAIDTRRRRIE